MPAALRRLLMVLASCAFLAWSLQRLLYLPASLDSSEHDYVITAPAGPLRNPASQGDDVWLLASVVDGRVFPLKQLERTGSWEDVGFALVHRRDGQPATIRVRGRQVLLSFLTSQFSGIVRVEGTEGRGLDLDLFHPDRPKTTFVAVDLAGGQVVAHGRSERQDPVRTIPVFLCVLLAALLWRPWNSASALETWVLVHVSLLHALVWLTQGIGYNADAGGYMDTFAEFLAGKTSYFPPGYPLLLGRLRALFPNATGLAVSGVQHILMVLALYGIARVARACLGEDLASTGLLIAGSAGPTLFLPQTVFSENPAFFGMAGALWFVLRRAAADRAHAASTARGDDAGETIRFDVAAGILIGWAALARVSPLVSVALPVLLLHAHQAQSWPKAVTRTARVLLTAIVVLGLTATWNWSRTREFSIANSSGLHLYSRVVTEQFLTDREGPATRRFLSIVGDRRLKDVAHWDISAVLLAQGLSYGDRARLMGDVALEGARSQPLALLRHSLNMAWDYSSHHHS